MQQAENVPATYPHVPPSGQVIGGSAPTSLLPPSHRGEKTTDTQTLFLRRAAKTNSEGWRWGGLVWFIHTSQAAPYGLRQHFEVWLQQNIWSAPNIMVTTLGNPVRNAVFCMKGPLSDAAVSFGQRSRRKRAGSDKPTMQKPESHWHTNTIFYRPHLFQTTTILA